MPESQGQTEVEVASFIRRLPVLKMMMAPKLAVMWGRFRAGFQELTRGSALVTRNTWSALRLAVVAALHQRMRLVKTERMATSTFTRRPNVGFA